MDATTVWEAGESLLTRELREEIVNSYPTLTEEERDSPVRTRTWRAANIQCSRCSCYEVSSYCP